MALIVKDFRLTKESSHYLELMLRLLSLFGAF